VVGHIGGELADGKFGKQRIAGIELIESGVAYAFADALIAIR
jgi:hypothetical protein